MTRLRAEASMARVAGAVLVVLTVVAWLTSVGAP